MHSNQKKSNSKIKNLISVTLILVSLGWLFSLLYKEKESFADIFGQLTATNIGYLCLSTLICTLGVGYLFFIFLKVFNHHAKKNYNPFELSSIFFSGQIIRYLPGRFFGIAYQVNETRQTVPPLVMIRTNIEFMFMVILFHTVTSSSILVMFLTNALYGGGLLILGLILTVLYLRCNWIDFILQKLHRVLPGKYSQLLDSSEKSEPYPYNLVGFILFGLFVYVILYFVAWILLKEVFLQFTANDMIILCASYVISWIIGFVSIITPGGLGVREISFVYINSQLIPELPTAFLAVFIRVWLIAIDILLFFISYGLLIHSKSKKS